MQECMSKYPTLYGTDKDDETEDEFAQLEQQNVDKQQNVDDSDKHHTDSSSSKQPSS